MPKLMVLVVDDDTDVLQTTALMMRGRGFETLVATDGSQALDLCARYAGQIDAIIADLSIPGDHSHFTHTVRTQYPDIRVIYATGIPRHIALASGLVDPSMPYVEKPADPDVLESLIRGQVTRFVKARDIW